MGRPPCRGRAARPHPRPGSLGAVVAFLLLLPHPARAQGWAPQESGTTAEFRGLSAADSLVVWAAGRGGVFARTVDGGRSWTPGVVPGAEELFFIDVHAVDASTAYLLGTHFDGGLGRIYRTDDAGRSWTLQYERRGEGVFFDGMAFWDDDRGIAFSDPVDGSFLIVRTEDGGRTWIEVPPDRIPPPLPGEAGFAASGTAIVAAGSAHAWFGTGGGPAARVFRTDDAGRSWSVAEAPLPAGPTAGLFGLAFRDTLNGVAVGGNYRDPAGEAGGPNVLRTEDGGRSWRVVGRSEPAGVRYGVVYALPEADGSGAGEAGAGPVLVAVGPAGSGWSPDDGATWLPIGDVHFNTVAFAGAGAGWAAGPEGRIARWVQAARQTNR